MTTENTPSSSDSSSAASAPAADERPFQADVARLLELVVHSIYSDRDVFLRELISNGADACEKMRFEIASAQRTQPASDAFSVRLSVAKEARTLTVEDNGIGMSAADLENALGVIANSGTRAFLEAIESNQSKNEALIGRFGIGFYSSFMVADRVDVFTRRAGETQAHVWSSNGRGAYSLAPTDDAPAQGARVVLHMKEDADEFLDPARIKSIVRQHSAGAPIQIEFIEENGDVDVLSDGAALWTRPKSQISQDQYNDFYKTMTGHFDEPALTAHWRAEGRQEFDALGFVPGEPPFDLFNPNRKGHGRLYVRHILVSEDADLLPPWLRFVAFLVDSADIPLNVSREMVQKSPLLAAIRKAATGRILQELIKLADSEDPKARENYARIWKNFGAVLKEGLYEDPERRDALFQLARFSTTKHPNGDRALKSYVADLRPNQTAVYYLTGADAQALMASPHLEAFAARGIEVLLLTDPVDSFWVGAALGFDGKPFKSVAQGDLDIDAVALAEGFEAPAKHEATAADAALFARLKQSLEGMVSDARASQRMQDSAACLTAPAHGVDRNLARLLGEAGKAMEAKPILEINLSHPLIATLRRAQNDDAQFARLSEALFGLARIADGELPEKPAQFARELSRLLSQNAAAAADDAIKTHDGGSEKAD